MYKFSFLKNRKYLLVLNTSIDKIDINFVDDNNTQPKVFNNSCSDRHTVVFVRYIIFKLENNKH